MTNLQLHYATKAVLNFLLKSDEELVLYRHFNTPSYENMIEHLKPHNIYDIARFSKYVNDRLNILPKPLWKDLPSEFFGENGKSIQFYETAIDMLSRKKKIERLLKTIK